MEIFHHFIAYAVFEAICADYPFHICYIILELLIIETFNGEGHTKVVVLQPHFVTAGVVACDVELRDDGVRLVD